VPTEALQIANLLLANRSSVDPDLSLLTYAALLDNRCRVKSHATHSKQKNSDHSSRQSGKGLQNFMKTRLWLLLIALLAVSFVAHAQDSSPADEKVIRDVETKWEAAWNRHDIAGMVRLFAPDADAINLAGQWFKGRDAFAKSLEGLHSAKVKESIWQTEEIHIKFLTPEIAVVHVYFDSRGEKNPDGTPLPPRRGIFTRVEVKREGEWLIAESQATKIVPPETVNLKSAPNDNWGQ
jgi:uncharacterized protein (TIGR02246 family)